MKYFWVGAKIFALTLLVLIIASGLVFFGVQNQRKLPASTISYTVQIPQDNLRIARVSAELTVESPVFYMSHEGVDPTVWADFVRNLSFVTSDGTDISFKQCGVTGMFRCAVLYDNCTIASVGGCLGFRPGVPKWRINAKPGDQIVMSYDVLLEHDGIEIPGGRDSGPFVTDWGVFYIGRALFIANGVVGRQKKIEVKFDTPSGWNATTPWMKTEPGPMQFSASDLQDLQESLLFLGTHEAFEIKIGEQSVAFGLGGPEIQSRSDEFKKLMAMGMSYYKTVFGGPPLESDGQSAEKIAVIINSSSETDGEAIGRNFNMLVQHGSLEENWQEVVNLYLHELMHLWNGKTITPAIGHENELEWFREGTTEYYALRALLQTQNLSIADGLERLQNELLTQYTNDPGSGKISFAQAGADKDNHWGQIYGGGAFVSLALDIVIRDATNGESSLDSVMSDLYAKSTDGIYRYRVADIRKSAEEAAGTDLSGFFDTYVTNAGPLPLKELDLAGVRAREVDGKIVLELREELSTRQRALQTSLF